MSVVLIHLTDIHITANDNNAILEKEDALVRAINSVINKNDTVVFTITGDLAYSGLNIEYDIVAKFLDNIKKKISSNLQTEPLFIMVPGNHDCSFNKDDSIRPTLMKAYTHTSHIPEDAMNIILATQYNYKKFSTQHGLTNDIITTKEFLCHNNKKVLFILINSAWISTCPEKPGAIYIPSQALPNIDCTLYDCILTLMHHPTNWLHPDNAHIVNSFIRNTTDILLLGHEHSKDEFKATGDSWSIIEKRGKELQNSYDPNDSAFSVYILDDDLSSIETKDFIWRTKLNIYRTKSSTTDVFHRNSHIDNIQLRPNEYFLNQLDDIEILIKHPYANDITLSDIFCWPTLEILSFQNERFIDTCDNEESITKNLLISPISIIVGDSLSGKTALSKMLFLSFQKQGNKCLSCSADVFSSHKSTSIDKALKELIVAEYNDESIDFYLQTNKTDKIFLMDNFNKMSLSVSQRCAFLNYLSNKFAHIIVFADSYMEALSQITALNKYDTIEYNMFKIAPMGNVKRKEFISNWMSIGNQCEPTEFENKLDKTLKKINKLLGSNKFIVPSSPIYLLNLLQDLNSVEPSFKGSQYGFLYGTLVQKSLSGINYKSPGEFNIDISVVSELAFKMLVDKKNIINYDDIETAVVSCNTKHKIKVNCSQLLNNMLEGNILVKLGLDNYKFKYPYLLYYFTGRYIAHNISDKAVKKQVEYMSQRLYNEDYGNILIFACHFSSNQEIIDDVLASAYCILDDYVPFDFTSHSTLFSNANQFIEKMLVRKNVGDESSIVENRHRVLEVQDEMGVLNGEVAEINDFIDDSVHPEDKIFAEFSSAQKTMEVLGQIISNYPGDIDGNDKLNIIDEIHMLGMRVIESLLSLFGCLLEDLLRLILDNIDIDKKEKHEIETTLNDYLAVLIGDIVRSTISRIGQCLNADHLLCAVDEVFNPEKNIISQQLVRQELKCNCLNKLSFTELCKLQKYLKEQKNDFASIILTSIVSNYLCYNNCGTHMRNKLCSQFNLSSNRMFIEVQKNSK